MSELKPCPWCGCVPDVKDKSDISDKSEFYVYVCPENTSCAGSKMVMGFFGTKDNAVKFWNTRAHDSE